MLAYTAVPFVSGIEPTVRPAAGSRKAATRRNGRSERAVASAPRMDDVFGYFTALGLATAAGLNAWIPLLATGLLARFTGLIDLDDTWDVLEQTSVLSALGAVASVDFVGDKVPAVDHALHAAGTVIAPVTGVVAALAST